MSFELSINNNRRDDEEDEKEEAERKKEVSFILLYVIISFLFSIFYFLKFDFLKSYMAYYQMHLMI